MLKLIVKTKHYCYMYIHFVNSIKFNVHHVINDLKYFIRLISTSYSFNSITLFCWHLFVIIIKKVLLSLKNYFLAN